MTMATTAASLSRLSLIHRPPCVHCRHEFSPAIVARRRLQLQGYAVMDDPKGTDAPDTLTERTESDKLVDGMDFGELCNDFECFSSPSVESTARQLVRDILELREGNRALGVYAISVKYKDPVRTYIGREKYKRPLWAKDALENPTVTVQEMSMLSRSQLQIKWRLIGKPRFPLNILGNLVVRITSLFTLNQISGQVIEHEESWDLSESSSVARAYFWVSRRFFSLNESGKDSLDAGKKSLLAPISMEKENLEVYPDPQDLTKFFQRDDDMQRDAYQIALFLAIVYFVVQFLRTVI